MLKVKDIMTRDVVTVSPETEILQAVKILLENHINGVPVMDADGNIVGILCQSDLVAQQKKIPTPSLFTLLDGFIPLTSLKHIEKEVQKIAATSVTHAMTPDPVTVQSDATVEEVATIMVNKNFHTIPVMEEGKLVGIVGKEDILRTLMPEPKSSEFKV